MVVDGVPNIRTCVTPLAEGMDVRTQDGVTPLAGDKADKEEADGTI